jgi:hypothetical protein
MYFFINTPKKTLFSLKKEYTIEEPETFTKYIDLLLGGFL